MIWNLFLAQIFLAPHCLYQLLHETPRNPDNQVRLSGLPYKFWRPLPLYHLKMAMYIVYSLVGNAQSTVLELKLALPVACGEQELGIGQYLSISIEYLAI